MTQHAEYAYVALKDKEPIAIVFDESAWPNDVAETVAGYIRSGLTINRMPANEAIDILNASVASANERLRQ
jgi:hypothetical protein